MDDRTVQVFDSAVNARQCLNMARGVVLGVAALMASACEVQEGRALPSFPIDNDLAIEGFEQPLSMEDGSCEFGSGENRLAPPRLRVLDEVWSDEPDMPPSPASPHRSVPIRVRRMGLGDEEPDRVLYLSRASVRWACSERDNSYDFDSWQNFGIGSDWQVVPFEIDGLDQPFCGPNLEEVTTFELPVRPLALEPSGFGIAWVEVISPSIRRRLVPYVDIIRLAAGCLGNIDLAEGTLDTEVAGCRRLIDAHQRGFPDEPPLKTYGHVVKYLYKVGKGILNLRPEITLVFTDQEGFEYAAVSELQLQLRFWQDSYWAEFKPGHHLCFERALEEI